MKGILSGHFNSLAKSLKLNIAAVQKRRDKHTIHTFRVLNKKLRAFLILMQKSEPEMPGTAKAYRKLRKLFKEAGKIRDVQIQMEILKEFKFNESGTSGVFQQLNTNKGKNRFAKKLGNFNVKKALSRISANAKAVEAAQTTRELASFILKFSKSNIAEAISLAEKNELHKARAKLKTAHFCLDIIKNESEAKALIATIDPIEQKTGKWRDCTITSEILKRPYAKTEAGKKDQRHSHEVGENIMKEISRLEFQILRDFKRLKKILG